MRVSETFPLLEERAPSADRPVPSWKRTLETTTFLLTLLGLAALGSIGDVPRIVLFTAAMLLIPGAILSRHPNPLLYSRAWNLATLLFLAGSLVFARWNVSSAIQTLAHLCVFLLLHKIFNYRHPRDYFQVWTLALMCFLLVPLSQQTPPLIFGVLLLVMLGVSVWHFGALAWCADLNPGRREARVTARRVRCVTEPAGRTADTESRSRPLAQAWSRLILAGLFLTVSGFLLLPRPVLPPAIREAETAEAARARQSLLTGFSQGIDLTQISSLRTDPTVALRLSGGLLLRGETVRLRAGTLDWFDGFRWERSPTFGGGMRLPRRSSPPEFRFTEAPLPEPSSRSFQRVQIVAEDQFNFRGILTLPNTVGLGGIAGEVWMSDDGSLTTWPVDPGSYVLFVQSEPQPESTSRFPGIGDGKDPRFLQLPERIDPAWVRSRAEELTGGVTLAIEKARQLETYFKRNGVYTLDLNSVSDRNGHWALQRFLDSSQPKGHCELFASAMALMARSLGLPSRVVTGFLGGDYDEEGNELVVRYQNAHAWVEVWIPDRGWMTFDPTPPAPLVSFSDRLPFFQVRQWMIGAMAGWQKLANDYGGRSQRAALAWMGDQADRFLARIFPNQGSGRGMEKLIESLGNPVFQTLALLLLVLNGAAILLWRRMRRSRQAGARIPGSRHSAGDTALWDSIRATLLAAVGHRESAPPPGKTLNEFIRSEADRNQIAWEPLGQALAFYESRRFGTRTWSPEDERIFRSYFQPSE